MGRPSGWAAAATGRPAMRSPGRPPVARREERQRFWAAIAAGLSSEDAAAVAGVSPAVGTRWFRESGGMPPITQKPLSGRHLSFAEREEIAILRARGCGVREIARRAGQSASTISRELRRNAATRGGCLEYRATTAQWHADRRARRPKAAKLAVNEPPRRSVEDRLSGAVRRPGGAEVEGPPVRWIGRRHGRRGQCVLRPSLIASGRRLLGRRDQHVRARGRRRRPLLLQLRLRHRVLMGRHAIVDRAPKGRDEGDQPMSWLRRHDEYHRQ
jgi:transposase, IS30 family